MPKLILHLKYAVIILSLGINIFYKDITESDEVCAFQRTHSSTMPVVLDLQKRDSLRSGL